MAGVKRNGVDAAPDGQVLPQGGIALSKLRENKTLLELSRETGIDAGQLSRYENGKSAITLDKFELCMRALGKSVVEGLKLAIQLQKEALVRRYPDCELANSFNIALDTNAGKSERELAQRTLKSSIDLAKEETEKARMPDSRSVLGVSKISSVETKKVRSKGHSHTTA